MDDKDHDFFSKISYYNTAERKVMNELMLLSERYQQAIDRGLPFYTENELKQIIEKYPNGITWSEIDAEISSKGIILKKPTFRKYIQNKAIPPSIKYRSIKKGREAIYPPEIIIHINFMIYFKKIADKKGWIEWICEEKSSLTISAKDAIEEKLTGDTMINCVLGYLRGGYGADCDVVSAIVDVLGNDKAFCESILNLLDGMAQIFHDKYSEFESMLMNYEISPWKKENTNE